MEENQSILELQVDQTASKNLSDATRWAKFLSITGFICMGLMLIVFIAMQSQIISTLSQVMPGFTEIPNGMFIAVVVAAAAIVCILLYFLFRGSILIKKGIETKSQETFNTGLASLRAYFIMYGVLAIIGLISNLVGTF